ELGVPGEASRDLLGCSPVIAFWIRSTTHVASKVKYIGGIVGFVDRNPTPQGKPLYNAAALLENGEIAYVSYKSLLPTYDVFDEDRYFEPAAGTTPLKIGGQKIA